jgi:hypothetical protein
MKPARGREVASNLVLPEPEIMQAEAEPDSIVDLVKDIANLSNQIKQEELL